MDDCIQKAMLKCMQKPSTCITAVSAVGPVLTEKLLKRKNFRKLLES